MSSEFLVALIDGVAQRDESGDLVLVIAARFRSWDAFWAPSANIASDQDTIVDSIVAFGAGTRTGHIWALLESGSCRFTVCDEEHDGR